MNAPVNTRLEEYANTIVNAFTDAAHCMPPEEFEAFLEDVGQHICHWFIPVEELQATKKAFREELFRSARLEIINKKLLEACRENWSAKYGHALGCWWHLGVSACSTACTTLRDALDAVRIYK